MVVPVVVHVLPKSIVSEGVPVVVVAAVPKEKLRCAIGIVVARINERQVAPEVLHVIMPENERVRRPGCFGWAVTCIAATVQTDDNQLASNSILVAG